MSTRVVKRASQDCVLGADPCHSGGSAYAHFFQQFVAPSKFRSVVVAVNLLSASSRRWYPRRVERFDSLCKSDWSCGRLRQIIPQRSLRPPARIHNIRAKRPPGSLVKRWSVELTSRRFDVEQWPPDSDGDSDLECRTKPQLWPPCPKAWEATQ